MRRNGENKEVVDEIIALAKRYSIATPYTSFLAAEDERMHLSSAQPQPRRSGAQGTSRGRFFGGTVFEVYGPMA